MLVNTIRSMSIMWHYFRMNGDYVKPTAFGTMGPSKPSTNVLGNTIIMCAS